MTVAPLDQARLAALAATGSAAMIFDRLDEPDEYADVIAALRGFGQQSACLLPLATALGPVGLIAFASSREGTYRQCDTNFLRHIGALVAMAIDNERHQHEAIARERQLQAERDHWRTLLEVTNAVVTERDVAALRAAIVPNVRRIVPHGPEPVPRHQVSPTSPRRQVIGDAARSPSGICLYFDTPTESHTAPTTLNLLNLNHIAEQPDGTEVAHTGAWARCSRRR